MEIVNIVCSGSFNQRVRFSSLSSLGDLFEYDPESYHGAYLRVNSKKVTIYKSGKYIFVGLKKLNEIEKQFKQMKKLLRERLKVSKFSPPKIQNMIIVDKIRTSVDFNNIAYFTNGKCVETKSKKFSYLSYKTPQGRLILFKNGSIVISGVKSLESAENIRMEFLDLVSQNTS
jgi:TATA-box binding protein (TBP) (component of TFIID and TFIIIB)